MNAMTCGAMCVAKNPHDERPVGVMRGMHV
jgi:hypothetical protein